MNAQRINSIETSQTYRPTGETVPAPIVAFPGTYRGAAVRRTSRSGQRFYTVHFAAQGLLLRWAEGSDVATVSRAVGEPTTTVRYR